MAIKNKQVLLASRPTGWVEEQNFRIVETDAPTPASGQLLVKNLFLSLDPYMRGRMNDASSYAQKVELGAVMVGGTVGEVVESNNPKFRVGDTVVANLGWQEYGVTDGAGVMKVDAAQAKAVPLSAYLGAVGMPGVTAWIGLLDIGAPKPGETVVVAAASGAVGGVVGQLAKLKGCRAVGIAGGKAKCDYVVNELGFDACVDHREAGGASLGERLRAAAPKGIDVYFENVGGEILDTVLRQLNPFARIPLCGLVSQYNEVAPYGVKSFASLLVNRVKLEGFIVSDAERLARWPEALRQLGAWVAEGRIKYRESITEGLESAPRAFIGMLKGENFGKQLVRLG